MAVCVVKTINGVKQLVPVSGSTPLESVQSGNMSPVTSNAVAEYTVDEVTSGNMHSVTSNAVAERNIVNIKKEAVVLNDYHIGNYPAGVYYFTDSLPSSLIQNLPTIPGSYSSSIVVRVEITKNFTSQIVKVASYTNYWYVFEYERARIDTTWFSWKLIRQTNLQN